VVLLRLPIGTVILLVATNRPPNIGLSDGADAMDILKFKDVVVCRSERFSIGIEESSGRFYLSIPVSNGLVDYEEYYEIDREAFELTRRIPKPLSVSSSAAAVATRTSI
jgi:hypothetical protein